MNIIPYKLIYELMGKTIEKSQNLITYNYMDLLPNELIINIFELIPKITDKRQILRVCKRYNMITKKSFATYEDNYKIENFDKISNYCMEKFTLELCYDNYFELIPKQYLVPTNKIIMDQYRTFGDIELSKLSGHNGRYDIFPYVGVNGLVQILKWAKENGCNSRRFEKCIIPAIENGNLDVLKYIKSIGYNWGDMNYIHAIKNGHLHILKWAKETGSRLIISICANAATYGQLEILKWARENGHGWGRNICMNASQYGHLHILEWAIENGCTWTASTQIAAASRGNISILRWIIDNGYELSKYACEAAAENGQLECLIWLHENGSEWNSSTCAYAAKHGHLECLKWARNNGCEWDKWTCIYAAEKGDLECLKWARNNECDWDKSLYIYGYRHPEIIKWAKENGCPEI